MFAYNNLLIKVKMVFSIDFLLFVLNNLIYLLCPLVYIPFLFPFNYLYEYFTIYNPNLFREQNSPEVHRRKVQKIQEQVKQWNHDGRKKKMCTARNVRTTVSVRNIDKNKFFQIKLENMDEIIEVDLNNMRIRVEPGMQMGSLTHKLLPFGVIIPVIPEFETLTIGGLINGAGLETSSHKYGLFASTSLEYEVILADGNLKYCSKQENSELFYAIPMSYGTLGFLTSVTFPLIKAGKYVKLEYHPVNSLCKAEELMKRNENQFIEGIAYSKDQSVIMFGNFSDTPKLGKINHINRWYKPWFYKHVESFLKSKESMVEYIRTRDYYHRHTRSYFWVTTSARITHFKLYIWLFGWCFPPNFSFLKMILPTPKCFIDFIFRRNILQDVILPMDKLKESMALNDELIGVYPIWLCPCKMFKRDGLLRCRGETDITYFDIGIYGPAQLDKLHKLGGSATIAVKKIEKFAIQNIGFQGMFTDSYLSLEDFDKMFDRILYEKLRTKFNCRDAFPDVYEKVSVKFKKN